MDANICDGLYIITNIKTTAYRETKRKLKMQRYEETPFGENPILFIASLQGYIVKQTLVPQTVMQAVLHGHTCNVLHN